MQPKNKSVFKTYLIYFIAMVAFCGVRIASSLGFLDGVKAPYDDIIFTSIIQVGVLFLIPFLLYMVFHKVTPKQVFKTCNFTLINFPTVLIAFALGVLMFFVNIVVSSIFNGFISFTGYNTPLSFGTSAQPDFSVGSFFINVMLVAVLPGICEEFLHRGLLLQGTKHIGFGKAIVISGILFGLIHFNVGQVSYAIILGLILGFASVVSKNIWVPIIMHFTNNFIAIYLDFAEANGWLLGNYQQVFTYLSGLNIFVLCAICFVALSIIALLLFVLIHQLYRQTMLRRVSKAVSSVYMTKLNDEDKPLLLQGDRIVHELLENNTMINLEYEEAKSPIEYVMPRQRNVYKDTFKDNIFLISSLVLGGLITIFTYVWGLL